MRRYITQADKFLPAHGLAACLVDLACQRQVNQHKLLRGTGIFREDLLRPDCYLSLSQLMRLLSQFQRLMPGHDSAFQLGHRLFPDFSAEANAIRYSSHLSQALRLLTRFRLQLAPLLFAYRYRHKGFSYLLLSDAVGMDSRQYQFVVELYCCLLVSASRHLLGQRMPFWFEFPFSRPRHIQEYEEHLGLRLAFDRPAMAIRFEEKWLSQPLPQASALRQQLALQQIQASRVVRYTLVEAVSGCLRRQRHGGLQEVADRLEMSPATLKRRLKEHNLRFSQLQDRVNMQEALYLLTVQGLNNGEVAEKLSFNDVPNFRRACKRWTGLTPSELRALSPGC
ncbi:helix-turn-helix transcriptional regulator [Lacimicrobium alkaliphilum]|uniref:AraC family transcriptional regulator n=1 Tax=Lacimicrobium alkaliphilum TaxID=1526571 RepID=A0ABQ1RFM5_9ALTE|nr:AraC family transcriptional regulator [Lacimicrobium alkaliphilum]GGD66117.1 AraC family transcriptional regulator [Lacimicrobium alkaliphilum]